MDFDTNDNSKTKARIKKLYCSKRKCFRACLKLLDAENK